MDIHQNHHSSIKSNARMPLQGEHPGLLRLGWQVSYYYGFAAQFTLLPFHQEYADSGHFAVRDRLLTSLRNNLIFYAVLAVRSTVIWPGTD